MCTTQSLKPKRPKEREPSFRTRQSSYCGSHTLSEARLGESIHAHTYIYICVHTFAVSVVNSLASQVIAVARTHHAIEREQISVTSTAITARGFVASRHTHVSVFPGNNITNDNDKIVHEARGMYEVQAAICLSARNVRSTSAQDCREFILHPTCTKYKRESIHVKCS